MQLKKVVITLDTNRCSARCKMRHPSQYLCALNRIISYKDTQHKNIPCYIDHATPELNYKSPQLTCYICSKTTIRWCVIVVWLAAICSPPTLTVEHRAQFQPDSKNNRKEINMCPHLNSLFSIVLQTRSAQGSYCHNITATTTSFQSKEFISTLTANF